MEGYTGQALYKKELGAQFDQESCAICMDDFSEEATVAIRKILKCGHLFHSNCIETWIKRHLEKPTCPLCNQSLKDQN